MRNSADDGVTFEWSSLAMFNLALSDQWTWFAELETSVTAERGDPWIALINSGWTWDLTDDRVIEFGTSWGLTRSAPDNGLFIILVRSF